MSPGKVAQIMRQIAARIDFSDQPSISRVQHDLQVLSSSLVRRIRIERVAREMLQIAQDDVELSNWDTEEGKDLQEGMKFVRRQEETDKLVPALKSLKHDVDDFITELRREPGASKPVDIDVETSARPIR